MRRSLILLMLCAVLIGCPARPAPRPEPVTPPAPAPAPAPAAEAHPTPPAPEASLTPPAPAPAPPAARAERPGAVMQAFMRALNAGEPDQVWAMLSTQTQQVMAPTEQEFSEHLFFELREAFTGWTDPRVAVDAQVGEELGVAAIVGDRISEGSTYPDDVRALAMVREGGYWRISLGVGPGISAAAPAPFGTVTAEEAVRIAFYAPPPTGQTHLWLDGKELMPVPGEGGMIGTQLPGGLKPGSHVVVAMATTPEGQPAAMGWSFQAK